MTFSAAGQVLDCQGLSPSQLAEPAGRLSRNSADEQPYVAGLWAGVDGRLVSEVQCFNPPLELAAHLPAIQGSTSGVLNRRRRRLGVGQEAVMGLDVQG